MRLYVEAQKVVRLRNIDGRVMDVDYIYRVYRRKWWFKKEYLEVAGGFPHPAMWSHGSDYQVRFGSRKNATKLWDRYAVNSLLRMIKEEPDSFLLMDDLIFTLYKI